MNNSFKGALYSGLVFPGLGQVVLKKHKKGIPLILVVAVSVVIFITKALQEAFAILNIIESSGGAIDMNTISRAANQAVTSSDSLTLELLLYFIILCWIIGIIDAYRIGRKKDIENLPMTEKSIRGDSNE